MNRYKETHDPKHPVDSVLGPRVHSTALRWFVGFLLGFFLLIGVAIVFWNAANPQPSLQDEQERVVGTSGSSYSTEGGHDPDRRPGSTRDELKFRGELTPPNGAPRR